MDRNLFYDCVLWERPENYLLKMGKTTEGGKLKMWTCTPPLPIPQGPGPGPWGIARGGVQVHIFNFPPIRSFPNF